MKVLITSAAQDGTHGEIHGYTLSAEQWNEPYHTGSILSVSWRVGGNVADEAIQELAKGGNYVWREVEPDHFFRATLVSAESGKVARYAETLMEEASKAVVSVPSV